MENLPEALVGVHLLGWIVTYPVDKVTRSLNNGGLNVNVNANSPNQDQRTASLIHVIVLFPFFKNIILRNFSC